MLPAPPDHPLCFRLRRYGRRYLTFVATALSNVRRDGVISRSSRRRYLAFVATALSNVRRTYVRTALVDSYFAFDRCGLLLGRIDQMIKTALVDSYFAFDRCGLLLGRIGQMIKKKGLTYDTNVRRDSVI